MNETLDGTAGGATGSYDTIQGINEAVRAASGWVAPLRGEIGRAIVGQGDLVNRLLVALLADGHVLLEGVPGLAKTLTLKTLSEAIDTGFQRIQFTPDMLPADIIGTEIYRPGSTDFVVKKGPVFSNLILADEINRAPSKVQECAVGGDAGAAGDDRRKRPTCCRCRFWC